MARKHLQKGPPKNPKIVPKSTRWRKRPLRNQSRKQCWSILSVIAVLDQFLCQILTFFNVFPPLFCERFSNEFGIVFLMKFPSVLDDFPKRRISQNCCFYTMKLRFSRVSLSRICNAIRKKTIQKNDPKRSRSDLDPI